MPTYGWCYTLNNYTSEQEETLQRSCGHCGVKYMIYGRETAPTTGTPHLQGYLQTNHKNKTRINEALGIFIIQQKGSASQARDYCKKEGDFFEDGTFDETVPGMKRKGERSDLSALQKDIDKGLSYDELCTTHFEAAAKYHKFIRERVQARDTHGELDSLRKAFESASLKPWQRALVDVVTEPPNPRKIHWIWEDKGNVGKSWMTKYLAAMFNACILTADRKTDMAYIYSKNPSKIVVFDLSRTSAPKEDQKWDRLDSAYSLAEDLKNGMVISTKYDSTNILTTGCHVIFFANFPPDMTKWSEDRYFITKL